MFLLERIGAERCKIVVDLICEANGLRMEGDLEQISFLRIVQIVDNHHVHGWLGMVQHDIFLKNLNSHGENVMCQIQRL